jgi:hypothetical protein
MVHETAAESESSVSDTVHRALTPEQMTVPSVVQDNTQDDLSDVVQGGAQAPDVGQNGTQTNPPVVQDRADPPGAVRIDLPVAQPDVVQNVAPEDEPRLDRAATAIVRPMPNSVEKPTGKRKHRVKRSRGVNLVDLQRLAVQHERDSDIKYPVNLLLDNPNDARPPVDQRSWTCPDGSESIWVPVHPDEGFAWVPVHPDEGFAWVPVHPDEGLAWVPLHPDDQFVS